jgi:hypothetical protein
MHLSAELRGTRWSSTVCRGHRHRAVPLSTRFASRYGLGAMAKRLSERALRPGAAVAEAQLTRGSCRNCAGAIIVDDADRRDARMPRRRVCRRCGTENGTTTATLYPALGRYSNVSPDFYSFDLNRAGFKRPI